MGAAPPLTVGQKLFNSRAVQTGALSRHLILRREHEAEHGWTALCLTRWHWVRRPSLTCPLEKHNHGGFYVMIERHAGLGVQGWRHLAKDLRSISYTRDGGCSVK